MNQSVIALQLDMYNFIFITFMHEYSVSSQKYRSNEWGNETATSNRQNDNKDNNKYDIPLIPLKCYYESSKEHTLYGMIWELISPSKSY